MRTARAVYIVEPYRYPPVCSNHLRTRHPSSLSFFIRLSWSFRLAITDRSAVTSRSRCSLLKFCEKVAASPLSEATLDVPVGSGRSKIVGIASGLSFFRQDIPIVGTIADAGWKQSSLKCLSHKKLCLDHRYYTLRRTRDLWNGPSKHRYYTLRTP